MLVKDSHLKDYDKSLVLKYLFDYLRSFTHPYHPHLWLYYSYHSLTLIVQLVSDCYIRIRARTRKLIRLCTYLVAKAEEPTPSLRLRSMVALIEDAMCCCLIYFHCVNIPCAQIVNTPDILYADVFFS